MQRIQLDREGSAPPLGEQIVTALTGQIRSRALAEGARLPSVRQLAKQLGVSPFTVVTAYDRLAARGLIEPRAGRGYFVAGPGPGAAPGLEALPEPADPVLGLVRQVLDAERLAVPAGTGFLPPGWVVDALPPSVFAKVAREGVRHVLPSPPEGTLRLREQLQLWLQRRGIAAGLEQVVVTFGASQGFDLVARALLRPGDAVLVEDPAYFALFSQLRSRGLRLYGVPRTAEGPDLAEAERLCRAHRPRAFFTQTLLHNPTGTSATVPTMHRLVSLAEAHDLWLVEDDVYGDLAPERSVRLAQLDGLKRVIYISSFTKVLSPGLRVGYLAAPRAVAPALVEQKLFGVLYGASMVELAVAEVLGSGRFRRHTEGIRAQLARARSAAVEALKGVGLSIEPGDALGVFIWARLPDGVDPDKLVAAARQRGILLAKGSLFTPDSAPSQRLRFSAPYSTDPALLAFLREHLGGPTRLKLAPPVS